MADVFVGSLMLVPYNFAPKGFAFAAGQILSISQNTALFSLLGTTSGGDGRSTFALPDLQGRIPIGSGQGPGLSPYFIGEASGEENVTLLISEIPQHTHTFSGLSSTRTAVKDPASNLLVDNSVNVFAPANSPVNQVLSQNALQPTGGSQPHNNIMPTLVMNWIIALQGIFPARS
jgi:microcystin-dependent protein